VARNDREKLTRILALAYSGEMAAAYAYRGHWRAARDPEERERIRAIEHDEWRHRREVGAMLRALSGRPRLWREIRAWLVGRVLGALCRISGWFLPMYAAGKLEGRNVVEYETAARYAMGSGRPDLAECLIVMAEVEWDHQAYFRGKVEGHPALRRFLLWPSIGPREGVRRRARDVSGSRSQWRVACRVREPRTEGRSCTSSGRSS
jgi:hypothetical protein